MLNQNILQTPFGVFGGICTAEYYEDGSPKSLRLDKKNVVVTHAGELIPYYSGDSQRRKYKASVKFYPGGLIKAVSLDKQQEIITPIGEFPAELVTFYPTGELKRVFPLDGQISGFWSEEDERELNIPFSFDFGFGAFTAMLVGLCFYRSGGIRSITLFPNETISVHTPVGSLRVKNGLSLFENGRLQSLEPAGPQVIATPIGAVSACDVNAVGINADSNSVRFDESGRLISAVTSGSKIIAVAKDGSTRFFAPAEKRSPLDEKETITIPLKLDFDYRQDTVSITGEECVMLSLRDNGFKIYS